MMSFRINASRGRATLTRLGYEARSRTKLNASRAGTARMTKTVRKYFRATGPRGVPNGFVDAKNAG